MAGESAREYARRQREKAARHARVAELYERGADGEAATGAALDELVADGWKVLHDVTWPGRPRANIDHIAVGPGGVFVIDSKNWSGTIAVSDDVLRQNGRSREKAVAGVAEASLAITALLGGLPATGVLCFVRDEPVTGWARDVMVCATSNVAAMLRTRPPQLVPAAVERVYADLTARLSRPLPAPSGRAFAARRPRPQAPLRPQGRPQTRARRRRPAGPSVRGLGVRGLGVALVLLLVLVLWGSQVGDLLGTASQRGVQALLQPTVEVGESHRIAGTTARPDLEFTVDRIVPAPLVARDQARGARGHAVRLTVRNVGDRAWQPADAPSLVAASAAGAVVRPVPAPHDEIGRPFPAGEEFLLEPGARARGFLYFVVPADLSIETVRLRGVEIGIRTRAWRVAQP